MKRPWLRRALPWAFYDWANSAFATTVMSGFVPLFNQDYWSVGSDQTASSWRLGVANSVAGIVVAVLAPILGAIADRGGARKRFLLFFAALGMAMTVGLSFAAEGQWGLALTLYAVAGIGFSGANVFYDSLLVNVAEREKLDVASALGYSLGYVGGGLLFALNVFMVSKPEVFGLEDVSQAVRWSFLTVAIWWAVFSIPLLLFVREGPVERRHAESLARIVRSGLSQLLGTFHEIRRLRTVFTFLVGYWLYIDGVGTVIRMAVDYGRELKLPGNSLILALLITQFVGFPAAIVFGKLGEKLGAKLGILIGLAVYVGGCVFGCFMTSVTQFYALAVTVGLVQGGVQSLSRSFFARLIPADKAGEFFGFYNMLGKFAVILGPILMAGVGKLTHNPRAGILSLILLFVGGAALLIPVKANRAETRPPSEVAEPSGS
jgi:MFS transporter, UMF1 family